MLCVQALACCVEFVPCQCRLTLEMILDTDADNAHIPDRGRASAQRPLKSTKEEFTWLEAHKTHTRCPQAWSHNRYGLVFLRRRRVLGSLQKPLRPASSKVTVSDIQIFQKIPWRWSRPHVKVQKIISIHTNVMTAGPQCW